MSWIIVIVSLASIPLATEWLARAEDQPGPGSGSPCWSDHWRLWHSFRSARHGKPRRNEGLVPCNNALRDAGRLSHSGGLNVRAKNTGAFAFFSR